MSRQRTLTNLHRRLFVDMLSVGCILLFWLIVAKATSMLVAADPVGAIGWAEVPTYAFLLAATVNAMIYLAVRLMAITGQPIGASTSQQ